MVSSNRKHNLRARNLETLNSDLVTSSTLCSCRIWEGFLKNHGNMIYLSHLLKFRDPLRFSKSNIKIFPQQWRNGEEIPLTSIGLHLLAMESQFLYTHVQNIDAASVGHHLTRAIDRRARSGRARLATDEFGCLSRLVIGS